MTAKIELGQDPSLRELFGAPDEVREPACQPDIAASAVAYQQIADRRAQIENAEILRRARAL